MLSAIFCRLVYIGFGILIPSFTTLRFIEKNRLSSKGSAITADDRVKIEDLLSYWTLFGVFSMAQLIGDMLIWWIPFYNQIKLLATCVLATCGTQLHFSVHLICSVVSPILHYSEPVARRLEDMVGINGLIAIDQ
ncbi:hypothetical protein ACOME3_010181 [Neoechinorhynchus agilis]